VTSDRRLTTVRSGDAPSTATAPDDDDVVRTDGPEAEPSAVEPDAVETDAVEDDLDDEGEPDEDIDDDEDDDDGGRGRRGGRVRVSFPLVPVLAVLLVLLLAGVGFLWFTRPQKSAVTTADYVQALQAARSGVVDLTSFDYLTFDDDIRQISAITTGDLKKEAIDQLNKNRQSITDNQATVNTEVVGAAVTAADATDAKVLLVIQSTQKSKASQQAQVTKYRIEATLSKVSGRWLLSGIAGR
jgi:Mce-associated membrane protein